MTISQAQRLLLLSSSRTGSLGYLEAALPLIGAFLPSNVKELLFIPYAAVTIGFDEFEDRVTEALAPLGVAARSIHHHADAAAAVAGAPVIVVGGGNTFALLRRLREVGLLVAIRDAVFRGARYLGWSAGSNVACPTIRTTNDMPVCDPGGLDGLGLIRFQINPHFIAGKIPGHNGESREERLAEFTAFNPGVPVLALPEGGALLREGDRLQLCGAPGALVFANGGMTALAAEEDVSWLNAGLRRPSVD